MEITHLHRQAEIGKILDNPPGIFRSFKRQELRELLATGKVEHISALSDIEPKDENKAIEGFLIIDGMVEARKMGRQIQQYVAGDFIGEGFLHSRVLTTCQLRATIPTDILTFNREDLMGFFKEKPERLLKVFTMNVIESQQRHICMLYKRIAEILKFYEER